jgi:hypothetical protein
MRRRILIHNLNLNDLSLATSKDPYNHRKWFEFRPFNFTSYVFRITLYSLLIQHIEILPVSIPIIIESSLNLDNLTSLLTFSDLLFANTTDRNPTSTEAAQQENASSPLSVVSSSLESQTNAQPVEQSQHTVGSQNPNGPTVSPPPAPVSQTSRTSTGSSPWPPIWLQEGASPDHPELKATSRPPNSPATPSKHKRGNTLTPTPKQ